MPSVLILEDDISLASTWRDALVAEGLAAEHALTSPEAIALDGDRHFDVFVVDLVLRTGVPGKPDSGTAFLQHLKRKHRGLVPMAPVLGVSGFRPLGKSDAVEHLFKSLTVDAFLLKPFSAADLVDEVNKLIAKRQAR